jgi:hypothetical protein
MKTSNLTYSRVMFAANFDVQFACKEAVLGGCTHHLVLVLPCWLLEQGWVAGKDDRFSASLKAYQCRGV